MVYILQHLKDPKLWDLWHVPCYGQCRIFIINRSDMFRPGLVEWRAVNPEIKPHNAATKRVQQDLDLGSASKGL